MMDEIKEQVAKILAFNLAFQWENLSRRDRQAFLEEAEKIHALYQQEIDRRVKEERNRVHVEINKMLEPLKLHLCWITSADIASEQYGFADEDGDDVDIGVIESALEAYEGKEEA